MFLQQLKAVTDNSGTTTAESQRWNQAKQARLAAWAGLPMNSPSMPPFWKQLLTASSSDKDAVIQTLLNDLSSEHMEFRTWVPHPQFGEDIKKMTFFPQHPSAKNWHRGLTPMAFADRDRSDIHLAQHQKDFWDAYASNIRLSTNDAAVLDSKAPDPPWTAEKLCLYTVRWLIFHKKIFGKDCGLYVAGKAAYAELLDAIPRILDTPDFMRRRGPSIMWELGHTTRKFYRQIVHPSEFTDAQTTPPKATVNIKVAHLMNLDGAPAGDLPNVFKPTLSHSNGGPKFQPTGTTNRNDRPNNKDNSGSKGGNREYRQGQNWTPAFQQLFGGYQRTEREKLKLGAICRECRKSVQWISERLDLKRGTCVTSVVLGQCPPTCRLSIHDVTVDDAKAAEVATVLASAVKTTAKAAGLKPQ